MNNRWLHVVLTMALLLGVLAGSIAAPATASAQSGGYTVPVTGGAEGFAGEPGAFTGSLSIYGFGAQGSDLLLQGLLDGQITDSSLSPIGNVKRLVAAPVADIEADCDGLRLILEPLGVDQVGYPIALEAIRVKAGDLGAVTKAQQDLLCQAGRLSDRNLPPAVVANLLNQLMAALGRK